MKADLARRLVALEAKKSPLSAWCVFLVPMGVNDEAIIGYQHKEGMVMREPGETLESLKMRTREGLGAGAVVLIRSLVEGGDEMSNRAHGND